MNTNHGNNRCIFIHDGKPAGVIGGTDSRYYQEGTSLVVLPDEQWGNPLFGNACLDDSDFHIHALLTLDELAGTGASVLLGGHYHYSQSRPDGNMTFRICLDEDIYPARSSLDKPMHIVHGRTNPGQHWNLEVNRPDKEVVCLSRDHITPGEPFAIDIYRRGEELIFEINSQEVFRTNLNNEDRINAGRCGDAGWPINVGFLPGQGVLRIHDFHAQGTIPQPAFPTSDVWHFNTHGYSHFRIPSLCLTPSGRLLAFTEARLARLSRNWEWQSDWVRDEVHCLMKYSDDNGRTWSEHQVLIDKGVGYEARDPVPVVDSKTGEIFLFTGRAPWLMSSKDEGRTWSEPRSLAEAGPGDFRDLRPGVGNAAIQLRHGKYQGRLLIALYQHLQNITAIMFSDDHGRTWQPGALAAFSGACEPSIIELSDGQVVVVPRLGPRVGSKPVTRLFMHSNDGGASFYKTQFEPGIPIPGQGELITIEPLENGKVRPIVFCGPAEGKTRLTMIVSLDDGKTWPISRVIDHGAAANLALVELPGHIVGVLYERDKYLRQCFQRVDMAAIINEEGQGQ